MIRRRKLARRRRSQDLEGFRADERERQRRRRMSLAMRDPVVHGDPECHVPASTCNSLEIQDEIHRILDGPFRLSRAGFGRELGRIERKIGSLVRQAMTQNGRSWTVSRAASSG